MHVTVCYCGNVHIITHTCTYIHSTLYMYVRQIFSHSGMLSSAYATMDAEVFERIPHETNAVESHHRFSKSNNVDILSNALIRVYQEDMLVALRFLALSEGIPVTYQDQTPSGRHKKAIQVNSARTRKRIRSTDDDGPPDKDAIFVRMPKRHKVCTVHRYNKCHTSVKEYD